MAVFEKWAILNNTLLTVSVGFDLTNEATNQANLPQSPVWKCTTLQDTRVLSKLKDIGEWQTDSESLSKVLG